MNILLTGAGGAAAISVWKSLAEDHVILMSDMDPCASGLYLVPSERRFIIPAGNSPLFIQALLTLCERHHIELLIPTVDIELLTIAEHISKFNALGVKIPLSPYDALARCRDKYALLNFCQNTGFIPSFQLLTNNTQMAELNYPCFAKPRRGSGSSGAMIIEDKSALTLLPHDGSYLIQELLPGEEYSVDIYIHSDGRPIAAVPRLRMKIDSGIAVAAQTKIIPELGKMALIIAEQVGIRYVANVQFKANSTGQFKLLEINPRFPGTLPLTAAAGVDIPKLLIDDINGHPMDKSLMPYKEMMVVRYWTEQFCSVKDWEILCRN